MCEKFVGLWSFPVFENINDKSRFRAKLGFELRDIISWMDGTVEC